jgi:hypothetical protein
MNEVKTIFQMRREGRLAEALEMARTFCVANPADSWGVKALAWVLRDLILGCLKAKDRSGATDLYLEFAQLPIGEDDIVLVQTADWLKSAVDDPVRPLLDQAKQSQEAGDLGASLAILRDVVRQYPQSEQARSALGWAIYRVLHAMGREEHPDRQAVLSYLREYRALFPQPKPGTLHSAILNAATKLSDDLPQFPRFFLWWGPDNFQTEDARPFCPKDSDQTFPSLVEKTIKALYRTCKGLEDLEVVGRCADFVKLWLPRFPEQEWFGYYYGRMLIFAGRLEEARGYLMPIIRKKQSEFWAWAALADTFGEAAHEERVTCLCQAARCPIHDESFKVGVHTALAELLARMNKKSEARWELQTVVKIRAEKWWKITSEIQAMQAADWAVGEPADDGNQSLYEEYGARASSILCEGLPWENAIVLEVSEARPSDGPERRAVPPLVMIGLGKGPRLTTLRLKQNFSRATRDARVGMPVRIRQDQAMEHPSVMAFESRVGTDWDLLPERAGIVLSNSDERGLTIIYLGGDEVVFLYHDRLPEVQAYEVGEFVKVRVIWNERSARFKWLTVALDLTPSPVAWCREFADSVRLSANGGFGFAGDVFIQPGLVSEQGVTDGCQVRGRAILRKKPNRGELGWQAVTVAVKA